MANVKPEEVDLLLLCTSTPDDLFGSAPQVGIEVDADPCVPSLLRFRA